MISSVVTWASSNPSVGTINGSALVIVMEPSTTLVKDSSKENKENKEHKEEKEHKEDKEHKDGKGDIEKDDED